MTTLLPRSSDPMASEAPRRCRRRRGGAWRVAGDLPLSLRYAMQGLGYGFISQRSRNGGVNV